MLKRLDFGGVRVRKVCECLKFEEGEKTVSSLLFVFVEREGERKRMREERERETGVCLFRSDGANPEVKE